MTVKKREKTDWPKLEIVIAVWRKGSSLRKISLKAGKSAKAAQVALYKQWPVMEAAIAREIEIKHPMIIWPSRYDAEGNPIRRKPGRKKRLINT